MPAAQRQPMPPVDDLSEQVDELGRQIRDCERRYPLLVDKGRLHQDTADRKMALLYGLHTRCVWLRDNIGWIKAEAQRRRDRARIAAEADALRAEMETHPAVDAIREQFPGAAIAHVRPLAPHGADTITDTIADTGQPEE